MTDILKPLAIAAMLVTVAASHSALAGSGSPYPDHFKNPTLSVPSVGAGSGIPAPYRLGD